jgi:hypothetical protein
MPITPFFAVSIRLTLTAVALYAQTAIADGPQPPCAGAAPIPAYADPPAVRTWAKAELESWTPPACLGWPRESFQLVVALAASFRHDGDADALLARFGAISAKRGLRYWSVTDKAWRVLITDAAALDGQKRRSDFTVAEMKSGADLYFEEADNRSSDAVVYRLRVLEASPNRVVVEIENVTPIRAFFITLFPPGSLRATYFAERRGPDTWGFYGLSSNGAEASALASVSEASYVNRAAALYRHFIGVPADRDPPLAP